MKTIHCGTDIKPNESLKPVKDGLWTTLIGTCTISELSTYISQCTERVLPSIVKDKGKEYTSSKSNQIRSMRVLYERGLIGKRKHTSIRKNSDVITRGRTKKQRYFKDVKSQKFYYTKMLQTLLRVSTLGRSMALKN